MKRSALFAIALGLSLAATASAGEFAGVKMPDTITAEGKTLKLNGIGLRKKVVFKVYVAGLYVESPSKDSAAIISAEEVKRMQLSVLRSLSTSQIAEAIEEGFEKGAKGHVTALKARLEKLRAMIPNVVEGDQVVFRVEGRRALIARTPSLLDLAGSVPVPAQKRGTPWPEVRRRTREARAKTRA